MPSGFVTPAAGGGSALPTGWTQAGSPANVDTQGGGLTVGAGGFLEVIDGGLDIDAGGITVAAGPVDIQAGDLSVIGTSNLQTLFTSGHDIATGGGDIDATGGSINADSVSAFNTLGIGGGPLNAISALGGGPLLGFFGVAPVAQPAAPVTLGDVIAGLQALGLFAT